MSDDLNRPLAEARERVAAMTPAERDAMLAEQARSWVRSIANWPKAKYRWADGVKVYDSFEDYCND